MPTEFESTLGIDPSTFASDLFDAPAEHSSENMAPPEPLAESPAAGAPSVPAIVAPPEEPWNALPKSWKKEMEDHWKTSSPDVRRYVHERETQIQNGISQYRTNADNWNKVTSPFQEVMKEYPNANLSEIISTLANNHLQMMRATPAERVQHAVALARGYGVELTVKEAKAAVAAAADNAAPPANDGFSEAQIAYLNNSLGPIVQQARASAEYVEAQRTATAQAEVDKFFSDPKNEFVNEVGNDILQIMQNRQANNLAEAYEIAVLRNPAVKPRYITSLAAKSAPPLSTAPKLPNVKSTATPLKSPAKAGTMDDTLAEVIAKHYP